ncbi:MAG TPA: SH3 domain-containing protein [Patescibacteria group bacterium]|nr:SH3 domain-containing protein [Patescibacteria group bacterium]
MGKIDKFLYYYLLIFTVVFFVVTILFFPMPVNVILLSMFVPVLAFTGIRAGKVKDNAFAKNATPISAAKLLTVMVLIIITGAVSYFINGTRKLPLTSDNKQVLSTDTEAASTKEATVSTAKDDNSGITKELSSIKEELSQIRAEQRSLNEILGVSGDVTKLADLLATLENQADVTPTPTEAPLLGYLTLSDSKYATCDVYEQKLNNSKIIGKMEYGLIYEYLKKEANWYQIKLLDGTVGWTNFPYLRETNKQ